METLERVRLALEGNPDAIVMILPDEEHRELLQAAVDKQKKNATAAKGTISALTKRDDPLLSRIIEGLETLSTIAIGARPASAQLDGTPMGEAIKSAGVDGSQASRSAAHAAAETVKQADSRARSRGRNKATTDEIQWAEGVPLPRPRVGEKVVTPSGIETEIRNAISYDTDRGAFRVMDSDDWDGLVVAAKEDGAIVPGLWHILSYLLEYTKRDEAPSSTDPEISHVESTATELESTRSFDEVAADNSAAIESLPAVETDTGSGDVVDPDEPWAGSGPAETADEEDEIDGADDQLWDDEEEAAGAESLNDHEAMSAGDVDGQSFETSGGIEDEPRPQQPARNRGKRGGKKSGGGKGGKKGRRRR